MTALRILLADDHTVVRQGLRKVLVLSMHSDEAPPKSCSARSGGE